MNKQEPLAARALLEELLWFSEVEWPELRGVPLGDSDAMFGQEVNRLQAFFPNNRLPAPAQELWREIQGLTDRGFSMRDEPSVHPDDIVRLHKALDALIDWLTRRYKLTESVSQTAETERGPIDRARKRHLSNKYLLRMLLRLEVRHILGKGGDANAPFTLRELQAGDETISTVRRGLLKLFPRGIKEQYWPLCDELPAMEKYLEALKHELGREISSPRRRRTAS